MPVAAPAVQRARSPLLIVVVVCIFLYISVVTNVIGALIPEVIRVYQLSLTQASMLPFCFFLAYGVMSVPAGALRDRYHDKPILAASFAVTALACLFFALRPAYWSVTPTLFVVGAAMAVLQVVINPLLQQAGGEEHFAFYSTLGQLVFGTGSFLAPHLYSAAMRPGAALSWPPWLRSATPEETPWVALYWLFAAAAGLAVVGLSALRFPASAAPPQEERGTWGGYASLVRSPMVWLYFASIFAYVGSEQGTANWISQFLSEYHRADPRTTGAAVLSGFWGLMTAGCVIGMIALKLADSRKVLIGASSGALLSLTLALFGSRRAAVAAFPLMGLFASVMWPVIFSLALNSVTRLQGSFAGLLCTGIVGGAIMPFAIGRLGDAAGLRAGMCLLYLSFGWVAAVGFWARPLVNNATLGKRAQTE